MEQQKLQSKLPVWIFGGIAVSLWLGLKSCAGQDFPPKSAEGKARQHEALITTNQTADLGAPAIHSVGAPSVVTATLLDRVAWTESRNNPKARGKQGEMGAYQLKAIAIREVNRIHGTGYLPKDAWDPIKAREIARLYLLICEHRCKVKTPSAVYAKYRGVR